MTNEEIQVCIQPSQDRIIKIEILNQNDYVVDEISGLCIDGDFNIDGDSAIRRTCSLKFIATSKLSITPSSPLWINKRFRLWIGITSLFTGQVVYFNMGTYIINDPTVDIQIADKTVSINGLDKMCYLDGTVSGELDKKTIIGVDIPISDAIKETVKLSGETKLLIDTSPYKTPYQIEKEAGSTIYDVLEELQNLYMTWKCFYDAQGNFVFRQIKNHLNDPVMFDFSQYNVIQTIQQDIKYSNIKNYFKVIGRVNSDGTQYSSELYVRDSKYPNLPFTIEKMGEFTTRNLVIVENKYYEQKQCDDRLEYEFLKHNNFADTINFTCVPLYFLDVDMVVYINRPDDNIVGNYCITSISCGLKADSLMNINAYKIYN